MGLYCGRGQGHGTNTGRKTVDSGKQDNEACKTITIVRVREPQWVFIVVEVKAMAPTQVTKLWTVVSKRMRHVKQLQLSG